MEYSFETFILEIAYLTMFKIAPNIESENLSLRPMKINDFDELFLCGGDKNVWAGHPSSDRYKKDKFKIWFSEAMASKSSLAIIDKSTNEIIGSTRFYFEGTPEHSVSIGYTFLAYKFWGGKVNAELKALMLNYAFKSFSSVWFHISPMNLRSQKAILKIGAIYIEDKEISLSGGKPILWKIYKISQKNWRLKFLN